MADNFGIGVSRVLDPKNSAYLEVVWQQGKPPLDSELNLIQQLENDWRQQLVLRGTPSGWLGNDTNPSKDYVTSSSWSNWFQFGRQRSGEKKSIMWAVVNGWLVPVAGTKTGTPPGAPNNTDVWNKITLDPPPSNSGDFRSDFVFLEVWKARVPPGPSSLNKPSSSAVYRYGNVEGGASYLPDDIQDPAIGFETSQRTQLQYRIRVIKGLIGLANYPDGFDATAVKAQGTMATPPSTGGYPFVNMQEELGDPGLWRAGDGTVNDLGTVDGYVYAIPLCVVFRRNGVAWAGDPSQNLNGGLNRNPTAIDRTGAKTFAPLPVLATAITDTASSITVVSAADIPLPANPASSVLIQIGEEILSYNTISGNTIGGVVRAKNGTVAEAHPAGSVVKVLSGRPDGLFSDQVALTDILDLRHVVTPNGVDYRATLQSNLDKLLKGQLRANWKRSGSGTQGTFVLYEDKISATPAGLGITKIDAPDRIRMIYSDASAQQPVEIICTPYTGVVVSGSQPVASNWSLNVISATTTRQALGDNWSADTSEPADNTDPTGRSGDRIRIPVAPFKNTTPGADADQVRLLNEVPLSSSTGVSTVGTSFSDPGIADFIASGVEPGDSLVIYYGAAKGTYEIKAVAAGTITVDRTIPATAGCYYEVRKGRGSVQIRIDGSSVPLPQHRFIVQPYNATSTSDLTLQFVGSGAPFPIAKSENPNIYVTVNVQYGGGRGLSRRPDSIHNLALYNPYAELMIQPSGVPQTNFPLRTAWAMLWSKYRNQPYKNLIPVTAEAYADLGSKTVILTPFQRMGFPATSSPVNGAGENTYGSVFPITGTRTATLSGSTLTDSGATFTGLGLLLESDVIEITSGPAMGIYVIKALGVDDNHQLETYQDFPSVSGTVEYVIRHAQGLMPLKKVDGVTSKWATTDPLGHFSGSTQSEANLKNFCVTLPRHLVPGWGAVYLPILPANGTVFHRGINFMLQSHEGGPTEVTDSDHNKQYINYEPGGNFSFAVFSTGNLSLPSITEATYNSTFSFSGDTYAGIKFFDDTRGLGRQGLQLPPFYGIARLWAVYEAADFKANGSAFDSVTREPKGSGAKNLLRQNFDGPVFWIEIDDDGDSVFILNADALDLSKSPTPISTFRSKHYVITASIFGFDRGSFDLNKPFKMVLSRKRTEVIAATRTANLTAPLHAPWAILPGPLTSFDSALINYSRTPYQGDPWGSQSTYLDLGYTPGPLTSATAYQLSSSFLDLASLTRPNQKALEVLASTGFITTLGTGRLSGDLVPPNWNDFRNVGYEDPTAYPPTSSIDSRPGLMTGALNPGGLGFDLEASPEYLGCTERLPLGALYRDKDFHGGRFSNVNPSPLIYLDDTGLGSGTGSLARTKVFEQDEITLMPASVSSGLPSDVLIHVDGEPGLYELLTNFRVNRGGSMFVGSGDRPGGEVFATYSNIQGTGRGTKALVGRAYLVRNAPTSVGANKASAGDELMMAVVTRVVTLGVDAEGATVVIGTNGTSEGSAAADLYRIEGHPLVSNRTKYEVDPNSIQLPNRTEGY